MPKEEFVVCALAIRDTAVIPAESPEAALAIYEKPEEITEDILIWACTKEEFKQIVEEGNKEANAGL